MGTIAPFMTETMVADALMESFVIEGGRPLNGRVRAAGNKNGVLPILAACVLTSEPVTLHNVPRIRDVDTMLALLADIGADVEWIGPNDVRVHVADIRTTELDRELCSQMRASFLLAGPLLVRAGSAIVAPPGGDVIGRRRLDPHIHGFSSLGAEVDAGDVYEMRADRLQRANVFLDEASVMATENIVMAAALTPGMTVIGNAACEPHVQDLCRFLGSLGARIEGIESNVLRIEGVDSLSGGEWTIGPDHVEVASFIGLAAVTGGDVTIDGVKTEDLISILPTFARLGVRAEIGDGTRARPARPGALHRGRHRRAHPEDRGRPVAGFPVRLHVDRAHRRDAGAGNGAPLREDVREPALLHGQARLDGRADHPLRPAPRRRHRPDEAPRPADGEPGHPRRDVDAPRRASAPRASRRSAPSTRSTRATSGSTSGCARSAPASSASRASGRRPA